ncbi:2-amino-4-hydroxy-6-hydroxymethyldihydropteridine diphosphokinase [Sandaracinus amylolyticus]|uniref:2-amino-4-hydroxy-6- hydroxymethyldihydropteridine diphosphokinase n=1 Tax=Sandaracinus amylolyticus TaxID=927083 RepID=UPI001F27ECB6|nr:2-amino-4-hydroxy-6-hydroxymethyldihydropteridine diphosphokinase [Sandaracinus amylolyticus]
MNAEHIGRCHQRRNLRGAIGERMWVVGIGLGANLGEREKTLQSAVDMLARTPSITVRAASPIYETEPVGPPQPAYLNAAVRVETTLEPEALLDVLLAVEAAHGRVRRERWGARTLDLDVLVVCDPRSFAPRAITTPRLTVPHPHLLERTFALAPLLDVVPELEGRWGTTLRALGGPPARAQGSQSIVVPERH